MDELDFGTWGEQNSRDTLELFLQKPVRMIHILTRADVPSINPMVLWSGSSASRGMWFVFRITRPCWVGDLLHSLQMLQPAAPARG